VTVEPPIDEPAPNPIRYGGYLRLEPLGEGRFGTLYRGRDERSGREVTLRVLPDGFLRDEPTRRRFRTAALALFRFHHPNVADALDVCHEHGQDVVVAEYVPARRSPSCSGAAAFPSRWRRASRPRSRRDWRPATNAAWCIAT